jgi:predicted methyltransferase
MSIDRDDSDHTIVCTADVGAVALAIDIFHQYPIAGPKGPLFTIARRDLEVTVEADQELPLGWMNTLTRPAARQSDKLKETGLEGVGHEQHRRWRPVVGFFEREFGLGEMAVTGFVGVQSHILHGHSLPDGRPSCGVTIDATIQRELHMILRASAWTFLTVLSAAIVSVTAQAPRDQHEAHQLHQDPKAYIAALEDPRRDAYQKPHEVLEALGIKPGEIIADIGAGSGYFTVRLAHHVGPTGRVYAVDISPDMIQHLQQRVDDMKLSNVSPILARPDDPLLPKPVDRFLIVDVWHHVENQSAYLAKMKERMKPGGQIVMIDFHKRELPVGPPLAMKISREDLVHQMEAHGFRMATEHTFLPYQYFLVFEATR